MSKRPDTKKQPKTSPAKSKKRKLTDEELRKVSGGVSNTLHGAITQAVRKPGA